MKLTNYELLNLMMPPDYRDILEMQEILRVQGLMFDQIEKDIKFVEDNAFLDTLTPYGANRWEVPLKLEHNKVLPIEDRRLAIKLKRIGQTKLTGRKVKALTKAATGETVKVKIRNACIYLDFGNLPDNANFRELNSILVTLKPAHLALGFNLRTSQKFMFKYALNTLINMQHMYIVEGKPINYNSKDMLLDGSVMLNGNFLLDGKMSNLQKVLTSMHKVYFNILQKQTLNLKIKYSEYTNIIISKAYLQGFNYLSKDKISSNAKANYKNSFNEKTVINMNEKICYYRKGKTCLSINDLLLEGFQALDGSTTLGENNFTRHYHLQHSDTVTILQTKDDGSMWADLIL